MTIKSDGEIHMCMEDYNNEIFLGDARKNTLYDIWNGKLYDRFRQDHFDLNPCIKCNSECDMPKIGEYFHGKKEINIRTDLIQLEKLFA